MWFELSRLSRIVTLRCFCYQGSLWEGFLLSASFFPLLLTLELFVVFLKAEPQLHEKLNSKGKNWFQIVTLVTTFLKLEKLSLYKWDSVFPRQSPFSGLFSSLSCQCLPASCTWSFLITGSPQLPQRICFLKDLEWERSQLWNFVGLLSLEWSLFSVQGKGISLFELYDMTSNT